MKENWSVWTYGSVARGDADRLSDHDVLVVGPESGELGAVMKEAGLDGDAVSISRYSWEEIVGMAAYGSLFLHHVRLEGRPLYENDACRGRLRGVLGELGAYALAPRDVQGFKTVLGDVAESLQRGGAEAFELSVLGTVIRHASILGCWLLGNPTFGRLAPVKFFSAAAGLAVGMPDFERLYMYRLYCDGRVERGKLHPVVAETWLRRAQGLVGSLEDMVNERHCEMPARDRQGQGGSGGRSALCRPVSHRKADA